MEDGKSHVHDGLCPPRNEQRRPVSDVDVVRANVTEQLCMSLSA